MADPISVGLTLALTAAQMGIQASRKIEGPRLTDRSVSLGDPGDAKNYFLGTRRFDSCSFIFAEDLREVKKKRKTKGGKYSEYKYYDSWANHIADHPIDAVTRVWMDKHLVFDVTGSGPVTVLAAGDISNYFTFYLGSEDQEPDPRMAQTVDALLGEGSCPAYRGQSYAMFKDIPLETFGNRLPQPTIEAVTNPVPHYPYESFPVSTGNNGLFNTAISPDGTRLVWGDTDSFEIWDLPTRTLINRGSWPEPLAFGDSIGIMNNGNIIAVGAGAAIGSNLAIFSPDASASISSTPLFAGVSYWQNSIYALTDGLGVEHWGSVPYSTIQYFFFDGSPARMVDITGVVWRPTAYFTDGHGDIWAVGCNPGIGVSSAHFYRIRNVSGAGGPDFLTVTGLPATGSFLQTCAAVHVMDGTVDQFVFNWGYGGIYAVSPTDGSILTSQTGITLDAYNTQKQIATLRFGARTVWLNDTELSLVNLSVVRTVTMSDWLAEGADGVLFLPGLRALGTWPTTTSNFTIRYLDRVTGEGVTIESFIDMVSGMCGVEAPDYDASLCTDLVDGIGFTAGAARSVLSPVLEAYDIDPVSEDFLVRFRPRGSSSEGTISTGKIVPSGDRRFGITIAKDEDLPLQVTMAFADVDKDQQPNVAESARAADAVRTKRITQLDMRNMATDVDTARHLADRFMRRQHGEKESYEFSLTDRFLKVTPGSVYTLELDDLTRIARCVTARIGADRVTETRWVRDNPSLAGRGAGAGAALDSRTQETIQVPGLARGFMLDVPLPVDALDSPTPFMLVAAGPFDPNVLWAGADIYASDSGDPEEYDAGWATIPYQNVASWGVCSDGLGDALPWVPDNGNSITVVMRYGTLSSVTVDDLLLDSSLNLVLIGQEYVQFATATLIAPRTYQLSGFLRGRRGTEQHVGTHAAGDSFLLMDSAVMSRTMGADEIGDTDWYKAVSLGREETSAWPQAVTFSAAAQKPYAPVHGELTLDSGSGDWSIDAMRRTRIGGANVDGQDVPMGETFESWTCDILAGAVVVRTLTGTSLPLTYAVADQTTDFGTPQTSLSVNLYQMSPSLSLRGFPLAIAA